MSIAEELPTFRYHPDPIGSGSIKELGTVCIVCGTARGYIYTGPIYCVEEVGDEVCPWCIADGTAHVRFDAEFTDMAGIGHGLGWDEVSNVVLEEVAHRTPGFSGWQQERWWTHCGDAAEFLGPAGGKELSHEWSEAVETLREDSTLEPGAEWDELLREMDRDGSPTAYVFRCRHCGKLGGYWDCD